MKKNLTATIVTLLFVFSGLYFSLYGLEWWADRSFAQARLASMLLAVLNIGLLILALCIAPALSLFLGRVLGNGKKSSTTGLSALKFMSAGAVSTVAVFIADFTGWLFADSAASESLFAGFAIGALLSAFGGILCGVAVWSLIYIASPEGTMGSWTIRPIARAGTSLLRLCAASAAAMLVVLAAIPVRVMLDGRPWIAAAVDLATLLIALLGFIYVSNIVEKIRPQVRNSWQVLGFVLTAFGVLGCIAAGIWRPYLFTTGLLELVHIANVLVLGTGAWLLIPVGSSKVQLRLVQTLLAIGFLTAAAANWFETCRPGITMKIRPSKWFLVDIPSKIDLDGDGYSPLFGVDCNDLDPLRNPSAVEIPGNGIDDNCRGGDRLVPLPWKKRPSFVNPPPQLKQPQRILLLVVDSLRADRLSYLGYGKNVTPHMDRLAEKGVRFTNAYSAAPCTRYAFPILFTGRYLPEILWNNDIHPPGIRKENTTVTELIREAGYKTAAFLTCYSSTKPWGIVQGFDHVDESLAAPLSKVYRAISSDRVVNRAIKWIENQGDSSWFTFIHFMDPHSTYMPHKGIPDFGKDQVGRYDGEVFFTDRAIGRLMNRLEELGLDKDTAIVLMGDHGELFGEHGGRTHCGNVWQEVLKIPLIIVSPGLKPRDATCVTSHMDLAPTILNLLGMDGGEHGMTAATLIPTLLGECDKDREIVAELGAYRALVGPQYKIIQHTVKRTEALYDLIEDPKEQVDLSSKLPWVLKQMQERLFAFEENRSSKNIVAAIDQAVVAEVPAQATPLNVLFPNGIELLAANLGNRKMTTDSPRKIILYWRTTTRPKQKCLVRFHYKRGEKKARLRGLGSHHPVNNSLPFQNFPEGKVVEDVSFLAWRGQTGAMSGQLSLRCNGRRMGALPGPNVSKRGYVDLGTIHVSKNKRRQVSRSGRRKGGQ